MLTNIDELVGVGERVEKELHPSRYSEPYLYWFAGESALLVVVMLLIVLSLGGIVGTGWFYPLLVVLIAFVGIGATEGIRRVTNYYVTSDQLVVERGLMDRDTDQARFDSLTDVSIDMPFLGRFVDIGTVRGNTAGADRHEIVFEGVRDPEGLSSMINERIEAENEEEQRDDAGGGRKSKEREGRNRSRSSHRTTARTSKLSVTALQNEIGRIERQQHQLEERRKKDLIDRDEYRAQWFKLRGRIDELNDLIDRLER